MEIIMKRTVALIILLMTVTIFMLSCTATTSEPDKYDYDLTDVSDLDFYNALSNIYSSSSNRNEASGKTMRLSGYFRTIKYTDVEWEYYQIYRTHPDNEERRMAMEVIYPENSSETYPEDGEYVEMAGTLETYVDHDGTTYINLVVNDFSKPLVSNTTRDIVIGSAITVAIIAACTVYVLSGKKKKKKQQ